MSTQEWILYTDINSAKTFIATCTPKKWCYCYIIVLYVHHTICQVYIYNISINI